MIFAEYTDENTLIPKNTSLIVVRVPLTVQQKRIPDRNESSNPGTSKDVGAFGRRLDLSRLDGSEDDKIKAMMFQSTQDYDPSKYVFLHFHKKNKLSLLYANFVFQNRLTPCFCYDNFCYENIFQSAFVYTLFFFTVMQSTKVPTKQARFLRIIVVSNVTNPVTGLKTVL